ncbi:MAG: MATE family efflux transporter, partial [Pseudolabrys sp.]|nr:MATE family efflux transporter [Pseudolabrys sp.]
NSIYLGRLIGVQALAAASGLFPVIFLVMAFFVGLASGSSILIGQAYGARNEERLKAVAGTTLTVVFGAGIVLAGLGWVFCPQLLHLIATPHDVFEQSLAYARVTSLSLPLLFVYLSYTMFVRGTGDSRTPFISLIVSTMLNAVFTPALIQGWLGLPQFGVASAALAAIVANALALAYLLVTLAVEKSPLALGMSVVRYMKLTPKLLLTLLKIGIPTGVQFVMISLAGVAIISLVNRFGSAATAAYGAVNQIDAYVQYPAISIGMAASIFGAQSIGAERFDRLRSIARAGVALNWTIGGVLISVVYLFNDKLLGLFITDPSVLRTAHDLLAITLWSIVLYGTSSVLSGLMRSSGAVLWPTMLAIIAVWGAEVPTAYALAPRFGLIGVWMAYPVAFAAGLVLQAGYYYGVWRRKELTPLLEAAAA